MDMKQTPNKLGNLFSKQSPFGIRLISNMKIQSKILGLFLIIILIAISIVAGATNYEGQNILGNIVRSQLNNSVRFVVGQITLLSGAYGSKEFSNKLSYVLSAEQASFNQAGLDTRIYLIDSSGYEINRSDVSMKTNKKTDLPAAFITQAFKNRKDTVDIRIGGVLKSVAYGYIEEKDWIYVVAVSKASYLKPISRLQLAALYSGLIAVILAFLLSLIGTKGIVSAIKDLNKAVSKADTGDLTVRADTDSGSAELKELSFNFNIMLATFGSLVKEISASIEEMTTASDGLSAIATKSDESTAYIYSHTQKMADGSQGQQKSMIHIRESMENISSNIQNITQQIGNATKASNIMVDTVNTGLKAMKELGGKITEIRDASAATVNYIRVFEKQLNEINSITNTISNISDQTKLLSLNAAIEAARAGQYGFGFTVVAQEIQKLAQDSAQSASGVGEIIKKIKESTQSVLKIANNGKEISDEGAAIAANTDAIFNGMLSKVSETNEDINNISSHVFSIADHIQIFAEHIAKTMEILNYMTESTREVASAAENNYSLSRDVSSNAQGLQGMADKMNRLKDRFKTE